MLLAGLRHGAGLYLRIFAPIVAGALLAWAFLGALSGFVTLLLLTVGAYFLLWLRADKRQRRMISQLPAFLDNMVRLITIGNSMASAFQTAAASADAPLREVVETAAALSRSAKELDEALAHVSRQYGLKELYMVAAVVSIALRFGGRSDQVLERMAAFMRDVSQARSELSASSAEIRLSAWILALLPLGIAGFIIVANNDLFVGLWEDRWASRCWRPPWPCRSADPIGCIAWPNPSDGGEDASAGIPEPDPGAGHGADPGGRRHAGPGRQHGASPARPGPQPPGRRPGAGHSQRTVQGGRA